jgi:hypothetical protein
VNIAGAATAEFDLVSPWRRSLRRPTDHGSLNSRSAASAIAAVCSSTRSAVSSSAAPAELEHQVGGEQQRGAGDRGGRARAAGRRRTARGDRYQNSRRSIEHPMMRAFAEINTTSSLRSKSSSAGIMLHEWHIGTM